MKKVKIYVYDVLLYSQLCLLEAIVSFPNVGDFNQFVS